MLMVMTIYLSILTRVVATNTGNNHRKHDLILQSVNPDQYDFPHKNSEKFIPIH